MLNFTLLLLLLSLIFKKQCLTLLLSLELLVLFLLFVVLQHEMFYALLLICVGACEGAVGLSALIHITRKFTQL